MKKVILCVLGYIMVYTLLDLIFHGFDEAVKSALQQGAIGIVVIIVMGFAREILRNKRDCSNEGNGFPL